MEQEPEIRRIDVRYDGGGKILEQYIVGFDCVTKIDTYSFYPEPYCTMQIVRVWRKDKPHVAFCRTNVAAVYYVQ